MMHRPSRLLPVLMLVALGHGISSFCPAEDSVKLPVPVSKQEGVSGGINLDVLNALVLKAPPQAMPAASQQAAPAKDPSTARTSKAALPSEESKALLDAAIWEAIRDEKQSAYDRLNQSLKDINKSIYDLDQQVRKGDIVPAKAKGKMSDLLARRKELVSKELREAKDSLEDANAKVRSLGTSE
jgi:uncharacterized protein YukE